MPRIRIHKAVYQTLAAAAVVAASLAMLFTSTVEARAASKERVLHTFTYRKKGGNPVGSLVLDSAGNLYGAALAGGGNNHDCPEDECGAIFELTPIADGKWRETLLYAFKGDRDGERPRSVILDLAGSLYGTTYSGGDGHACFSGCGLVFKLMPSGGAGWSKSVLHEFRSADGENPTAGLTFDSAGNLYGTTESGGLDFGVVFELVPTSRGKWKEKVLHTFTGKRDGAYPSGNLILDAAGNISGTVSRGGDLSCDAPYGCGVIFELMRSSGEKWKEKVLHVFTGRNGSNPDGGLVLDANGNLYGSADGGSASNSGIVFELTPQSDGKWKESVLHAFSGGRDGAAPNGDLVFDSAGNLYGTSYSGGFSQGGAVFELTPTSNRNWKEVVLHDFTSAKDGVGPASGVTLDGAGNVFGTTFSGGVNDAGVAFEIPTQ